MELRNSLLAPNEFNIAGFISCMHRSYWRVMGNLQEIKMMFSIQFKIKFKLKLYTKDMIELNYILVQVGY